MGRPREFDQDKVLDAASRVFWANGYEATSTRALSEATSLTPASIYNAFGDKRGLFLSAMEHYLNSTIRNRIARHEALPSASAALTGFFTESMDRALSDPDQRGCMLVNTALESTPRNPELTEFVAAEMRQIEAFFLRVIKTGQKNGEFPKDLKPEDLAAQFLTLLMGMRVLSRVRPEAKLFNSLIRPAFAQLGLVWPNRTRKISPTL
ncbi:MAG: TetR/AcrR family transcriptional regulator [Parvibaculum sp.]|nr:TetR/AcrR family transcriptional regulator [Parvibaculum sp.]